MKLLLFFLFFFSLFSCSSKYNLNEEEILFLNKEIDEMHEKDQSVRLYFNDLDSIYGINKSDLNINIESNKKIFLGEIKYKEYKLKVDSLYSLIRKIDNYNTPRLIEITRKYGFPNNKRLNVFRSKAFLIFVHAPSKYFNEINGLIEKEYKEGRIDEYTKEHIFWNTKRNRIGSPPLCGKDGKAIIINDVEVFDMMKSIQK